MAKNFRLINIDIDVNEIPYNLTFYALHATSLFKFCIAVVS